MHCFIFFCPDFDFPTKDTANRPKHCRPTRRMQSSQFWLPKPELQVDQRLDKMNKCFYAQKVEKIISFFFRLSKFFVAISREREEFIVFSGNKFLLCFKA